MTPTVLRAKMPDLLAVAFYQIGYLPRESLVLVGLHGPRMRVGVVVRGDLPPPACQGRVVAAHLDAVRCNGHDGVIGLVVSDAVVPSGPTGRLRLPHRALVEELQRQAPGQGLLLRDVVAVGPSRWRSYRCTEPGCCPMAGRSLDEALNGRAATELIARGHILAAKEADLVADVEPVDTPVGQTPPGTRRRPGPVDAEQALRRWRELLDSPDSVSGKDLVDLCGALQDHGVRDSVLLTLVPGAGTLPEEVLAGVDSSAITTVFQALPDPSLLERGRVILSAVARSAPPGSRADSLALLAWASWWSGRGARGRLLAERALADVPGHRLAVLVDRLLYLGVPPDWAQGQPAGVWAGERGSCAGGACDMSGS
jgi:hypothetical protein